MLTLEILRQPRIGPFAIFDVAVSYIGILIISPLLTWIFAKINLHIPLASWLWLTLPISVVFHLLFSQNTPIMKILQNPSSFEFYLLIATLLFMTYMGLKDVSPFQ